MDCHKECGAAGCPKLSIIEPLLSELLLSEPLLSGHQRCRNRTVGQTKVDKCHILYEEEQDSGALEPLWPVRPWPHQYFNREEDVAR